jgi:mitofusin
MTSNTNLVTLINFVLCRELSSTFARLCHLVDETTDDMDTELKSLEKEIRQLEEAANSARLLRNKANYISKELEIFEDAYLKHHN